MATLPKVQPLQKAKPTAPMDADSASFLKAPASGLAYTPKVRDRLLEVIQQGAVAVGLDRMKREVLVGFIRIAAAQVSDEQVVNALTYFVRDVQPALVEYVIYGRRS